MERRRSGEERGTVSTRALSVPDADDVELELEEEVLADVGLGDVARLDRQLDGVAVHRKVAEEALAVGRAAVRVRVPVAVHRTAEVVLVEHLLRHKARRCPRQLERKAQEERESGGQEYVRSMRTSTG